MLLMNLYNNDDTNLFISEKIVKGCGHCNTEFTEEDYNRIRTTSGIICPHCQKKITVGMCDENRIIIANSQEELDSIPLEFDGIIYIKFGTPTNPAILRNKYKFPCRVGDEHGVYTYNNSNLIAFGNAYVRAYNESRIEAFNDSSIVSFNKSFVKAYEHSTAISYDESCVRATGYSKVTSHDKSMVIGYNTEIFAYNQSKVISFKNCLVSANDMVVVIAKDNSHVLLQDKSCLESYDQSIINVYGASNIKAHDKSTINMIGRGVDTYIEVYDYADIVMDVNDDINVVLNDNARIINNPKDIFDFMKMHKIQCDNTDTDNPIATFYIVTLDNYTEDYALVYEPGKIITDSNESGNRRSFNVHPLKCALKEFEGMNYDASSIKLIECEVNVKDIKGFIHSNITDGFAITSKYKMVRECSLTEFSEYSRILDELRQYTDVI